MSKQLIKSVTITTKSKTFCFGVPQECDYIKHESGKLSGYKLNEDNSVGCVFEASDVFPYVIVYGNESKLSELASSVLQHRYDTSNI